MTFLLPENVGYLNIEKYWDILNPIYESPLIKEIALHEMNCARENKCKYYNFNVSPFEKFAYPIEFNIQLDKKVSTNPKHPYGKWTCCQMCHWIAVINMSVALIAFPEIEWRIINSTNHSTVWDGKDIVFDTNMLYFGYSSDFLIDYINSDDTRVEQPVGYIPFHTMKDRRPPDFVFKFAVKYYDNLRR